MIKRAYFASQLREGWPDPSELKPFFLGPKAPRWFFETGNDSASLAVEGVEKTEQKSTSGARAEDIELMMSGHPELGVLLHYRKSAAGFKQVYESKGDISRLNEHVKDMHGTLLPIGLFISYEDAWSAVREFMETDGALPKSIEWVESNKLPPWAFPEP